MKESHKRTLRLLLFIMSIAYIVQTKLFIQISSFENIQKRGIWIQNFIENRVREQLNYIMLNTKTAILLYLCIIILVYQKQYLINILIFIGRGIQIFSNLICEVFLQTLISLIDVI
ncbi:Transmembrane domain-containing protein [Spironucleus salmonicida]|uniref:Transmembrane domain-containing protein n=1 Tax=Spironucleus salmonicida TaxID=348837 RepID=V6LTB0_9EUKA|nr:Transmembrane domain-containing protein [Spironucleus salmonicida]|eukprot:EST47493.1 Transmembrane domain-containing protein [Spironucleus salmonicida]